jgi:hypothetical protein
MKLNKGDVVLVSSMFSNMFHVTILHKTWGIFGVKYLAEWNFRDHDYGYSGKTIGFIYWWRIVCKD